MTASTPCGSAHRARCHIALGGIARHARSCSLLACARWRNARRSCACLCLLLLAFEALADGGHPVTMWRVDGDGNRVYLLGSVHLLRADDHPLPTVIDSAYADAETIVMEVDMDDIDPVSAQRQVTALGLLPDDRSLETVMGPELYARAAALAGAADIPLAMLARTEPWLAAMTVEQLMLARIGFNPQDGVEAHLAGLASGDGKPVIGLETVRQQLELLDGMSLDAQRALLLASLEESAEIAQVMDDLVRAWRHGDIDYLESEMLADMQDYPELHRVIVVERNRAWVTAIEGYAQAEDDYLVVVGALHLIGDDGVPALLAARGYDVVQMHQPPL